MGGRRTSGRGSIPGLPAGTIGAASSTSSATGTRPIGADTWAPCTRSATATSISREIRTPSASASSLPPALAARIRSTTASGTLTPGTSLARNSAFRSDTRGQMPAMMGMRKLSIRLRKRSSWSRSNTGWVMAYSAPASTFYANRLSSRSKSGAAGFTPTPITNLRRLAERVAAGIQAVIEPADEIGQPDAVDVEDRGRVRIRPHLRRIAGDDEQVANAAPRPRRAGRTACPADSGRGRHSDDGLEADLALDHERGEQRAHAALRARAVRDVDRVDPGGLELPHLREHRGRVDALAAARSRPW